MTCLTFVYLKTEQAIKNYGPISGELYIIQGIIYMDQIKEAFQKVTLDQINSNFTVWNSNYCTFG